MSRVTIAKSEYQMRLKPRASGRRTFLFALLCLCTAVQADEVAGKSERAKVLGFTMDAPVPDDAVFGGRAIRDGASLHTRTHRLCAMLFARSDELGVYSVVCEAAQGVDWDALLRAKYGRPVLRLYGRYFRHVRTGDVIRDLMVDLGDTQAIYAADGFAYVIKDISSGGSTHVTWFSPRTVTDSVHAETSGEAAWEAILETNGFISGRDQGAADVIAAEDF